MDVPPDRLRTPFFVVALLAILVVVLLELGTTLLLGGRDVTAGVAGQASVLADRAAAVGQGPSIDASAAGASVEPPGRGIPYLALVDGVLLLTVGLMAAALVLPHQLHGRIQGVATLVGSIMIILLALVLLVIAIVELIIMVALLLAFPFGTIVYLILWGSFPTDEAALVLGLLMFLKLVVAAALLLAQQRFLRNKGLVLMVLTSLVCNLVVAFLHGFVPGILVSIADNIAAIVLSVIAIIWAVVLLVGSIPAIVKAVRSTASEAVGIGLHLDEVGR